MLTLSLALGNAALCAGWAPTAEARITCCTKNCPMHQRRTRHAHGHSDVVRGSLHSEVPQRDSGISQLEADNCCALSEERSSESSPISIVMIAGPILGQAIELPAQSPSVLSWDSWRRIPFDRTNPIPKYVLLSVFLV